GPARTEADSRDARGAPRSERLAPGRRALSAGAGAGVLHERQDARARISRHQPVHADPDGGGRRWGDAPPGAGHLDRAPAGGSPRASSGRSGSLSDDRVGVASELAPGRPAPPARRDVASRLPGGGRRDGPQAGETRALRSPWAGESW